MAKDNAPGLYIVNTEGLALGDNAKSHHIDNKHGGGGPVEPNLSMKDYTDAKIEAAESRLNSNIDKLATKADIESNRNWTIGTAIAVVGLVLSALAFGGDRFDGGLSVGPQLESARQNQIKVDARQDAQAKASSEKLDIIIKQTATR